MQIYNAPFYTKSELALYDESELQFPFSDNDAVYDGLTHQYELTEQYFLERGVNLQVMLDGNDAEKVKHFLRELRQKVYTYIYTHCAMNTRNQLNYMIAKGELRGWQPYEYRQQFLTAMFIEGCYLANNGDISSISGVDLDTMQNMSEDVMRRQERDFHRDAIGILKTLGLNYYGRYRFVPKGKDW